MNDERDLPNRIQILVIDDDELVRETLESLLRGSGYDVTSAADGRRGLDALARNTPDFVITDIYMPEKEGIETIVDIRRNYPDIKIIAMSGGADVGSMPVLQLAEMVGADRVLKKPFRTSEIVEAIESLYKS
jgi:CheY-like chemotaxis protein